MLPYKKTSKYIKNLGFKSELEANINLQLSQADIKFSYEGKVAKIQWYSPKIYHTYTADFVLANGIIIEAKGIFTKEDREKHLLIKNQCPFLDIRFIFLNPSIAIYPRSKTSYAKWCDKNGFLWAKRIVPESWLTFQREKMELKKITDFLMPDK